MSKTDEFIDLSPTSAGASNGVQFLPPHSEALLEFKMRKPSGQKASYMPIFKELKTGWTKDDYYDLRDEARKNAIDKGEFLATCKKEFGINDISKVNRLQLAKVGLYMKEHGIQVGVNSYCIVLKDEGQYRDFLIINLSKFKDELKKATGEKVSQ